jgi:NAD-dependent dihydropyrimidine dehydrogenase PreA subunit
MPERVVIDPARCTACGLCLDSCPNDVLRFDPASNTAVVAYMNDCNSCHLCEDDCPEKAITVAYGMANPRHVSVYDRPR